MTGKVVVNRSMSLDGFISGPVGEPHRWPRFVRYVDSEYLAAVAARTGAMLVGRTTWEVGASMEAADPDAVDYPFDGAMFLLSHRPLDPPSDGVTVLSGDISAAVATALEAAGGRDLELLGADTAAQCFAAGLVDEVLVYVLPIIVGEGVPFSAAGMPHVELEPVSSERSGTATVLRYRVVR